MRNLGQLDLKSNGIGFLRLLFASLVIWSHSWRLGRFGTDPIFAYSHAIYLSGYLAVGGFFVLSGFLITRSAEVTTSPSRFLWHRVLRIYPAFWMCLFITAFAVASSMFAIQFGSLHGFLQQVDGPIDYIYRNATLIILQQNIGNLMSSYPSPETINGSLWTLAWEFNCYICVGVFGIFTVFRFPKLGPLVVALLIAANRYLESGAHNPILIGLIPSIGLFVLFGLGSSAYLFRHKIPMHWGIALVALIVGALALPTELCREVVPICVAYLALYGAMYIPVRSFDRRIDLSYGVYLYGTPVAKLAVLLGLPTVGFPTFYPIVMVVVVALATGSWYFVERPAMRLRSARFNLRSVFLSEA